MRLNKRFYLLKVLGLKTLILPKLQFCVQCQHDSVKRYIESFSVQSFGWSIILIRKETTDNQIYGL